MRKLFLFLVISLFLLWLIPCVSATWDSLNYTSRIPIQINNTGYGSSLQYHQVYFNVSYDVDMEGNFTDLIFYNNSDNSIIPFCNITVVNNEYLEGYLNVTYLEASSWTNDTYYVYFNGTPIYLSDEDSTIPLFEDFTKDRGWTEDDPQNAIEIDLTTDYRFEFTNLYTRYTAVERVYKSIPTVSGDFIIEWEGNQTATSGGYGYYGLVSNLIEYYTEEYDSITFHDNRGIANGFRLNNYQEGVQTNEMADSTGSLSTTYYYRVKRVGTTVTYTAYTDSAKTSVRQSISESGMNTSKTFSYFYLHYGFVGASTFTKTGYHDNFIVRKYADPQPNIIFGEKETYSIPAYIPPDATNLRAVYEDYLINFSWNEGIGNITDSFSININDDWYNGTIDTFIQIPVEHGNTYNISIWAFNSSADGTLSNGTISMSIEIPPDYTTIRGLSVLLIFLCIVSLLFSAPLLSITTTIVSWYLAFNFIEIPLLAIFFAIIGLVYLLNPLLWLGEK